MVKIGYYFPISSFPPGTLDQITVEKAFCKAKALCEYRISHHHHYTVHKYILMPIAVTWNSFYVYFGGAEEVKQNIGSPC